VGNSFFASVCASAGMAASRCSAGPVTSETPLAFWRYFQPYNYGSCSVWSPIAWQGGELVRKNGVAGVTADTCQHQSYKTAMFTQDEG
jgi:hypothetical protein